MQNLVQLFVLVTKDLGHLQKGNRGGALCPSLLLPTQAPNRLPSLYFLTINNCIEIFGNYQTLYLPPMSLIPDIFLLGSLCKNSFIIKKVWESIFDNESNCMFMPISVLFWNMAHLFDFHINLYFFILIITEKCVETVWRCLFYILIFYKWVA